MVTIRSILVDRENTQERARLLTSNELTSYTELRALDFSLSMYSTHTLNLNILPGAASSSAFPYWLIRSRDIWHITMTIRSGYHGYDDLLPRICVFVGFMVSLFQCCKLMSLKSCMIERATCCAQMNWLLSGQLHVAICIMNSGASQSLKLRLTAFGEHARRNQVLETTVNKRRNCNNTAEWT